MSLLSPPSPSTLQSSSGGYSLALHVDAVQAGIGPRLRVPLCPAGNAINLNGRKIHFRVMVQTEAGFTTLDAGAGDMATCNPNGWNGPTLSYNPNQDKSLLPEGSWVAIDIPALQEADANSLTDFGIALGVQFSFSETWSGNAPPNNRSQKGEKHMTDTQRFTTIDDYISTFPEEIQAVLETG